MKRSDSEKGGVLVSCIRQLKDDFLKTSMEKPIPLAADNPRCLTVLSPQETESARRRFDEFTGSCGGVYERIK